MVSVVLCIAAPFSGTRGDESCMRDAKSRVRDEKELCPSRDL